MNRIRKAMLAFAIFGFFGGCEAVNISDSLTVRSLGRITQKVNSILKIQDNGNDKKGVKTSRLRIFLNDGTDTHQNIFVYHSVYNELMKRFFSRKAAYADENALCKSLLRFFLLDSEKDLKKNYNVIGELLTLRNNVKAAFLWHITKHYVNCKETRLSKGPVHTLIELKQKDSGIGGLKIGGLNISGKIVATLEDLLEKAIETYDFQFNGKRIEAIQNQQLSHDLLDSLGVNTVKECVVADKSFKDELTKIEFNKYKEYYLRDISVNAVFKFKLSTILTNQYTNKDLKYIDSDGDMGSFYFEKL